MSNVKIFVIYHTKAEVFKSDIYEPFQTGCDDSDIDLGFLKDNTGDNISYKNKNYGELTSWYWVLRNYIPKHPETEYIGFCHFRRFLDFSRKPTKGVSFKQKLKKKFQKEFNAIDQETIRSTVQDYDIILPTQEDFTKSPDYKNVPDITVYKQYIHPQRDMDSLMQIINEEYPEYRVAMRNVMEGHTMHCCLNFVMKAQLFTELAHWMFEILQKLEKRSDWSAYTSYIQIRTPAYLAERFFNVWLNKKKEDGIIRILERNSYLLVDRIDWKLKEKLKHFRRKILHINRKKKFIKIFGMYLVRGK